MSIKLLTEEVEELRAALESNDPIAVLDALTDIQYVLDGRYLDFEMADLKAFAFAEAHASNMTKLDESGQPVLRGDGKIMKSQLYEPPNLAQFFNQASTANELILNSVNRKTPMKHLNINEPTVNKRAIDRVRRRLSIIENRAGDIEIQTRGGHIVVTIEAKDRSKVAEAIKPNENQN